jgi:hypothetical protein
MIRECVVAVRTREGKFRTQHIRCWLHPTMLRLPTCLLFVGLVQAVHVYLRPPPLNGAPSRLSPDHAAFEISKHLGLESFESAGSASDYGYSVHDEQLFVGQGEKSGLLLSMDMNGVEEKGMCSSTGKINLCH